MSRHREGLNDPRTPAEVGPQRAEGRGLSRQPVTRADGWPGGGHRPAWDAPLGVLNGRGLNEDAGPRGDQPGDLTGGSHPRQGQAQESWVSASNPFCCFEEILTSVKTAGALDKGEASELSSGGSQPPSVITPAPSSPRLASQRPPVAENRNVIINRVEVGNLKCTRQQGGLLPEAPGKDADPGLSGFWRRRTPELTTSSLHGPDLRSGHICTSPLTPPPPSSPRAPVITRGPPDQQG